MNDWRTARSMLVVMVVMIAAMFVMPATRPAAAAAADPAAAATISCDGMAPYSAAMITVGKRWVNGMTRDGLSGRSSRTFSPAEWDDYAIRAERLLDDLAAIEAPVFAGSWHEASLATARLKINLARSASLIGFDLTAEFFSHRVAATAAGLAAAREGTVAGCADFAAFFAEWDGLDGRTSAATRGED